MEEIQEPELQEQNQPEPEMVLSPEAQYYLQQGGKWASFLGIIGFIFTGMMLLFAAFAGAVLTYLSHLSPSQHSFKGAPFLSFIYVLLALPYFFSSLYLYQFGSRAKKGVAFIDNDSVTIALSKLKSLFKLWGIFAIIVIAFYVLVIVGVFIGVGIGSHIR